MAYRINTESRFVILAPADFTAGGSFWNIVSNPVRHQHLLAEMQRFRGQIYIRDGAITPEHLTADGRHQVPIDAVSWHVLALDADGKVGACLRYLEETHARGFDELWVRHAALSQCPKFGDHFRAAVEEEMAWARRMRLGFGEVGGWAVAEERRGTVEPLRIILATYGLLELLGGCPLA
jgi:hypothetical protein